MRSDWVWKIHFQLTHVAVGRRLHLVTWTPFWGSSSYGFLQSEWSKRERARAPNGSHSLFYDLISDVTCHHFRWFSHIDQPSRVWEDSTHRCVQKGRDHWRASWRLATTGPEQDWVPGVYSERSTENAFLCCHFFFPESGLPFPPFWFLRSSSPLQSPQNWLKPKPDSGSHFRGTQNKRKPCPLCKMSARVFLELC